jgi:hypothetical protein
MLGPFVSPAAGTLLAESSCTRGKSGIWKQLVLETGEVSFKMRDLKLVFVVLAGLIIFAGACSKEDNLGLPTVDTVPPAPPVGVQIESESESELVAVRWSENAESDLAGYRVYKSSDKNGPFNQVSEALVYCPWFYDEVLPLEMTFYKITALDQSGNESAFSQLVGVYYNTDRKDHPEAPVE